MIRRTLPLTAALAVVVMLSLGLRPAQAQEAVKIGVASPARIFNEMQETKDLKQKIETDRKNLEGEQRSRQEKLRSLQEARDQLRPDSPQYQERNKELLTGAIEFETWGKITQADMQRRQKQMMKDLFDKIEQAVGEVAAQKGLDLVIAEAGSEIPENLDQINVDQLRAMINQKNVLFAVPKVDISNDVIMLLDSKYKAGQ